MRNRIRTLVLAAIAAAAVASAGIALLGRPAPRPETASVDIGGPFRMTDQDGRMVTEAALVGKPSVIFFGFTYCPEVCPTTLAKLTQWMKDLGPTADGLNVYFVSVDPERDTPAQLKLYLSNFDRRIQGLTGPPAELVRMTKAYRAYYQKVPLEGGGYTMDHSATLYLMDARGRFREVISYQETPAAGLAALRRLTM